MPEIDVMRKNIFDRNTNQAAILCEKDITDQTIERKEELKR
jgi:hypothetical protein